MDDATVRALAALNERFYREDAAAFDATRSAPWPGWQSLLPLLRADAAQGALRVLDVGCGNGRFARWLAAALPEARLELLGVDASEPLLERARRSGPPGARWQPLDVVAEPAALSRGPFDWISLFGVLHGIPGAATRRALLAECVRRLAPGAHLVFTAWRATADTRLRGRILDWDDPAARAALSLDRDQLEAGDHLLPWGEGHGRLRYFHAFDEAELQRCTEGLGLVSVSRYRADGRSGDLNEYLVFRSPPGLG